MYYNPITHWPLNELSGTAAINYGSLGTAANGTYNGGVTLNQTDAPGGFRAGLWDGLGGSCDILTPILISAFNSSRGTVHILAKVYNAGVWTDATLRTLLRLAFVGSSTAHIVLLRHNADNILYSEMHNNPFSTVSWPVQTTSSLDWMQFAFSWDSVNDVTTLYYNGLPVHAGDYPNISIADPLSEAKLGNWAIFNSFYGYISSAAIYDKVLTNTQIGDIYMMTGI
jgi:hypothetical protein